MSDQAIEQKIQEKGLTAPRITPEHINSVIVKEEYHVFPGSQLTVCCLTLKNGFTVSGESACASPENFNAELGEEISYKNAKNEIWALEGYLLKQRLYDQEVRVDELSFGAAIEAMKGGAQVARAGWNGRGIFCSIQRPDVNSKMSSPYIFIDTTGLQTTNQAAPKSLVPWLASQTDMLADDWQIVDSVEQSEAA